MRSETPTRAVRSDAPPRATRRTQPSGPLSIVHYLLFPHTAKLQHGGGEIKHLAQTMLRAPRFLLPRRRTALIVNRLVANSLSSFALAPLALSPLPCPLLLQVLRCYSSPESYFLP